MIPTAASPDAARHRAAHRRSELAESLSAQRRRALLRHQLSRARSTCPRPASPTFPVPRRPGRPGQRSERRFRDLRHRVRPPLQPVEHGQHPGRIALHAHRRPRPHRRPQLPICEGQRRRHGHRQRRPARHQPRRSARRPKARPQPHDAVRCAATPRSAPASLAISAAPPSSAARPQRRRRHARPGHRAGAQPDPDRSLRRDRRPALGRSTTTTRSASAIRSTMPTTARPAKLACSRSMASRSTSSRSTIR